MGRTGQRGEQVEDRGAGGQDCLVQRSLFCELMFAGRYFCMFLGGVFPVAVLP